MKSTPAATSSAAAAFEEILESALEQRNVFAALFVDFREICRQLEENESSPNELESERLLDIQSQILHAAAKLPAKSIDELVYKLALWRWDSSHLDGPHGADHRADKVAYSVFCDLAMLTGIDTVKTRHDLKMANDKPPADD